MRDHSRITVVTPSYQQARYLGEAIESVLSQEYASLEYFVVDGGSTDGSIDVIRRYADRLTWWVSEPDRGQADAVNKGFVRATGDILAFLNSDDFYLPGALQRVSDAFAAHPNAGIVVGSGQFVSETGATLRSVGYVFDPPRMIDGGFPDLPQPAIFIRRKVYEKIGGLDPELHYTLDTEFFWRALANFDTVFIPDVLAALRSHPASKSVTSGARFPPEILRNTEKVIAHPELYPRFRVEPNAVRSAACLNGARYFYNSNKHVQAIVWMAGSLKSSRRYAGTIFFRDLPRLLLHLVVRRSGYDFAGRVVQRGMKMLRTHVWPDRFFGLRRTR